MPDGPSAPLDSTAVLIQRVREGDKDSLERLIQRHLVPLRRYVTGRHLWHDPRRRQCALASLTSLVFDDGELVQLRYTEPAGRSDPAQTGA